jgi:mono/diheme cytochrome c family protein
MLWLSACGQGESPPPAASSGPSAPTPVAPASPGAVGAGDAEKGRQVYLGHCVTCHHRDPAKDGPLGPAVKGSSAELVAARVLQAGYPPGYVPKRSSRVMPARPDLSASVPDLAAYLR